MIIETYKPLGQTTVEFTNDYKRKNDINKICFAGRLDPLAHGKLYLLTDEDVHKKNEYCNKNKAYEANIIIGFTTDTYDIMGMPVEANTDITFNVPNKYEQKYPPYSSKIISGMGIPYWKATKDNIKIDNIPTKQVEIFKFNVQHENVIGGTDLLEIIKSRVNSVSKKYDFRQEQILTEWSKITNPNSRVKIIKIYVECSSGTYIRGIGNMLNGCCYDIHRVKYL